VIFSSFRKYPNEMWLLFLIMLVKFVDNHNDLLLS
jgi:hypothetical protein